MSEYKLSASLQEHEDDVRGVMFPQSSFVLSASRDATVRLWKLLSPNPPKYDCSVSSHSQSFVNAVTYFPPTSDYPDGLIISGGKDTIIDVRQPGKSPDENAEGLLLGHAHNVCALDVCVEGGFIVSGSWDGTARIWRIGKWECEALLEGHGGSVWTVLAYDKKIIISGCADKVIRIFDPRGKLYREIKGSADVVRALCRVPFGHPSGADFASAGNDAIIRLWKLDGQQVGELHGHESFIYSLVSLPTRELVSSGEDRTVRIWKGNECVQTITHPAISVWGVAACSENGDIVSGASDRIVRIFTRDKGREAQPEIAKAFKDSIKSSSIPQQQVGSINKEKLPGPEFLQQKSGTKEGQVQMIQEPDGSVSAHQWSRSAQSWMNVGSVVDAVGSSGKKTSYAGKDYDYVFEVDIEDGKPPLKLPYNLSQNPYEAATKFIQDNELPMTYLNQVANFITTNTQGATISQSQEAAGADPWGTGARYRPGETASVPSQPQIPTSRPKVLPQTTYLSIKTANLRTILKKISEFNEQLSQEGSRDIALDKQQLLTLESASTPLETALSSKPSTDTALSSAIPIVNHILTAWPPGFRLPALDLVRLLAAATPALSSPSQPPNTISIVATAGFEDKDRDNNIMLSIRAFGNLFETSEGRTLVDEEFHQIHALVRSCLSSSNRNTTIAIATLYLNYAVLFTSASHKDLPSSIDRSLLLLDDLTSLIDSAADSEAVYRALVAVGTLLDIGEEIQMAAREVYELESALGKAEKKVKEPRVKGVIGEIRERLKC
ncbi:MAG: hypothetical protein Q9217_001395 [Psora testacea]